MTKDQAELKRQKYFNLKGEIFENKGSKKQMRIENVEVVTLVEISLTEYDAQFYVNGQLGHFYMDIDLFLSTYRQIQA